MGNNNTNEKREFSRLPDQKVEDWPESEYMARDLNVMYRVINEQGWWKELEKGNVIEHPDIVGHSPQSLKLCVQVMLYIHRKGWDKYVQRSQKSPRPESKIRN